MKKLIVLTLSLFASQTHGITPQDVKAPDQATNLQQTLDSVKVALQKSTSEISAEDITGLLNALHAYSSNRMGLPRMNPIVAEIYSKTKDAYRQLMQASYIKPSQAPEKGKFYVTVMSTSQRVIPPLFLNNIVTIITLHNIEVATKRSTSALEPLLELPISLDELAVSLSSPKL